MTAVLSPISKIRRPWERIAKDEKGQALALVVIILTFGSLVISGFLAYSSTVVSIAGKDTDRLLSRYAAETGVTDVIADLLEGEDALSPSYVIPTPTVNDYSVTIAVAAPVPGTEPPAVYQYVDPGVNYGLKSVSAQTSYYITLYNVKAGSSIRVNWAFVPSDQRWKLRLYQGTGPPGAPAPTVVAQDNFESGSWSGGSGWLYDWFNSGDSSIVSTAGPYQGTYHLRLRSATGYVDRAVNLSGQTNMRLQFWAKASSLETGETATLSISPDDVNWTVVRVWRDGEDDNTYRFEDISLAAFPMSSEFWIAFDANMSGTGDYFWVDDIKLVSQAISGPIAEKSDTLGPGALFAAGSLISGGTYTIEFRNNSGTSLVSAPFSSDGSANNTWIYAQSYKDYVISSTAGDSTVTAYVRQAPGLTEPTTGQRIYIYTWQEP